MSDVTWQTTSKELASLPKVIGIYGDTYTGKTQLATTYRKPMAFFHYCSEPSGTISKIVDEGKGDIRVCTFGHGVKGRTREERSTSAAPAVELFIDHWLDSLSWASAIVLDTETGTWELERLNHFGGESPEKYKGMDSMEAIWAGINSEWRMLFTEAKSHGVDVVIISKQSDKYKNNKVVGVKSRGQKDIPGWCDIRLHTTFDEENKLFGVQIVKAGLNFPMTGIKLFDSSLPQVLSLIYGNDEGDWQ